jgi:hypothetical protein
MATNLELYTYLCRNNEKLCKKLCDQLLEFDSLLCRWDVGRRGLQSWTGRGKRSWSVQPELVTPARSHSQAADGIQTTDTIVASTTEYPHSPFLVAHADSLPNSLWNFRFLVYLTKLSQMHNILTFLSIYSRIGRRLEITNWKVHGTSGRGLF